jgi:hypothetical protein
VTGPASARELERVGYRAPLGLRCLDAVSGQPVGDGLLATAWRPADPGEYRTARRSPVSSLLGFGSLPGLPGPDRVRAAAGQPVTWPPLPAPTPYLVRVVDQYRRYLPVLLAVGAPAATVVDVPLDSAPTRPYPSGWATVRGATQHATTGAALPWCVVDIDTGADVYHPVSDGRGQFLLYLPYPEALPPLAGSPPLGPGLGAVTWPLTVRVRSQPAALVTPPGADPADPPERGSIQGQAAAQLDDGGGAQPSVTRTLIFGMPLVLRLEVVPA